MGKPAKRNVSFQITISKSVKEEMDKIIVAINEIYEKKNMGIVVNRSRFIETLLVGFITSHTTQEKEENKA